MKNIIALLAVVFTITTSYSQNIKGRVVEYDSKKPVEFVNIGIKNKNIGTTSNIQGKYKLNIEAKHQSDTLLFTSIGYIPCSVKISELLNHPNKIIKLKKKIYKIDEVTVIPISYKEKILGITSKSRGIQAGFKHNKLGYECGVRLKIKKTAIIEKVNFNIALCTYDSVFYRLNIYKEIGKKQFKNILRKPIYISLSKEDLTNSVSIDLSSKNIVVNGNTLITLEHVKDLGEGYLYFCVGVLRKTYYRETSQAEWKSIPFGVAINVNAKVEK